MVRRARLQGWCARRAPLASARASASSWFTVCVARTLARPICCSERLRSSVLVPSRCARSACMRRPARGVLSWCAASARKRFCVAMESSSRVSRSFTEATSGATSSGTVRSSSGLRSSGRRARMRCSIWLSGWMPRASASHTSSTASGRITNCGSITPLTISVASMLRFSRVSATCTRASAGAPCMAGSASGTQTAATRMSAPRSSSSRSHTVSTASAPASAPGCGRLASPASSVPSGASTW